MGFGQVTLLRHANATKQNTEGCLYLCSVYTYGVRTIYLSHRVGKHVGNSKSQGRAWKGLCIRISHLNPLEEPLKASRPTPIKFITASRSEVGLEVLWGTKSGCFTKGAAAQFNETARRCRTRPGQQTRRRVYDAQPVLQELAVYVREQQQGWGTFQIGRVVCGYHT